VEWLKVKALSSNPVLKKKKDTRYHECNVYHVLGILVSVSNIIYSFNTHSNNTILMIILQRKKLRHREVK
jgi:hypothetical protein